MWIHYSLKGIFCCITEVLTERSSRPLSSVPDVTHHLVTMQSGRQSYEVSVLTAVNPQEVKLFPALTLSLCLVQHLLEAECHPVSWVHRTKYSHTLHTPIYINTLNTMVRWSDGSADQALARQT